jgi:hypothetical protein
MVKFKKKLVDEDQCRPSPNYLNIFFQMEETD